MKLVQLLAKELKEWPEGAKYARQDFDGEICFVGGGICSDFYASCVASDIYLEDGIGAAQITEYQWREEREKINKPKWIRHRGGKCPVKAGTRVSTKHRDGDVAGVHHHTAQKDSSVSSLNGIWKHNGDSFDIMSYRVIEETKDQEIEEVKIADVKLEMMQGDSRVTIDSVSSDFVASVFVVDPPSKGEEVKDTNIGTLTYKLEIDATEAAKEIDSLVAKWGQIESPLKWRDAIIHCQAIIEDCEREIERNVNLLDAEGLMMQKDSKKAMQRYAPDVDMSDWRNWKRGDIISISNDPDIKDGEYKVTSIEEYDYDGDLPVQVTDGWADFSEATVKFVRRP